MFQEMMDHLKEVVLEQLFKVRIGSADLAPMPGPAPAAVRVPGWREIHGTNGQPRIWCSSCPQPPHMGFSLVHPAPAVLSVSAGVRRPYAPRTDRHTGLQ